MSKDLIVVKVDRARALLEQARDAPDAKKVADVARAAEVYARRQKLSADVILYATAVKVDALTLMGDFLKAGPKNRGAEGTGSNQHKKVRSQNGTAPPTLAGLGISKRESADAQALADLRASAPDLHEAVRNGTTTVAKARAEQGRRRKRAEADGRAAAARRRRGAGPPAWEVMAKDCVEGLAEQPAGYAKLIFADPPYNIGVDYGGGPKADLLPVYDYLRWCSEWIGQCHRVLADGGSFWLLVGYEYAAALELILGGTFVLSVKPGSDAGRVPQDAPGAALSALTGLQQFHVQSWVTWYESFGVNCSGKFNRCSRRLLYCVKDPNDFVFHPEAFTRPSDRQAKYNDKRAAPGGKLWDDVWGINPPIPRLTGTCAERIPDFPTQLPLKLLTPIVLGSSDPGDLVLDPFSGSGTTGVAAITHGRRYLGFESSPKFAGLSRKRLRAAEAERGTQAGCPENACA
jgi:site-specific DNA-methyltransferase (adenine-specific)